MTTPRLLNRKGRKVRKEAATHTDDFLIVMVFFADSAFFAVIAFT